jgi:hypothetical protein
MQFSLTTTEKSGILQECERYLRLGVAGITGDTARLAQFTNYVNKESRKVWHMIFTSYDGWQYDDGNQTDLPAAAATLTASQTSYALPTGSLTVKGVEVKDASGNWTQLTPITEEEIRTMSAVGQFMTTTGQPLYFQLLGQTVKIFPASNYTQASSFKVFFDRGSVAFVTTDTTATPGFASEYHDILPIGASLHALKVEQPTSLSIPYLENEYKEYEYKIKEYYSMKSNKLFRPVLRMRQEDTR